jgi:photosystem II stability/assembly factor-like uncharacterized protein
LISLENPTKIIQLIIDRSALIIGGLLLLTINVNAQNYWSEINSPTQDFLRALFFTDSLSGWVAGDSGDVFYTSDGGESWVQQETNTNAKLQDIEFIDENRGWAVGWSEITPPIGSKILSTTDGGNNWVVNDYPEPNVFLAAIIFQDSLNGWAGGYPGKLIHTTDGGLNWIDAQIDSGAFSHFPILKIGFFDSSYGFATGGAVDIAGVIWKTTNGGESWFATGVSPEPVRDLYFLDSLNVLTIGGDPEFFGAGRVRTTDAGNNWDYRELGLFGVATALDFRTPNECWAPLSFAETIAFSLDSGVTWQSIPTPGSSKIYDLAFTDSLIGYGVGFEGKIIKYKKPHVTSINDHKEIRTPFTLYQNYPNPFNPSTNIRYHISIQAFVTLKVYDVLGNEVSTLVDEFKPAGDYKVSFDISKINSNELTSGIYFLKLQAGNFITSKKMILLK